MQVDLYNGRKTVVVVAVLYEWSRRDTTVFTDAHSHTHTHLFNGPLSGDTQVSRYQKSKTNLDFTEARDSEWQWHQLCHMQVCISLQTVTMPVPHHSSFFTGQNSIKALKALMRIQRQ